MQDSKVRDIREDVVKKAEPHPWHWANEMCPCGAPSLNVDRPATVTSDVPIYR